MNQGADLILKHRLQAWADFLADPVSDDYWENDLFQKPAGMTATEYLKLWTSQRAAFRDKHRPHMKLGLVKTDDPWPTWSVALAGDDIVQDLLGKGGRFHSQVDGKGRRMFTAVASERVIITVAALNPDVCRWQTILVRSGILAGMRALTAMGLNDIAYVTAQDLDPEPLEAHEWLWRRVQVWTAGSMWAAVEQPSTGMPLIAEPLVALSADLLEGQPGAVTPESGATS